MTWDKSSKNTISTGNFDVIQDDKTRFSLETYERLPENKRQKYLRWWLNTVRELTKEESKSFDSSKIWPISLGKELGTTKDLDDGISFLKDRFHFINSSIFTRIYENYFQNPIIEELQLEDFVSKTSKLIDANIGYGRRIIISRVLETNAKQALGSIYYKLKDALGKNTQPIVEQELVPVEELNPIGTKESKRLEHLISLGCPKKLVLDSNKGISTIPNVTVLRHLWLYLGTITFAYSLSKEFPQNFNFYFGKKIPSARDTIIIEKPEHELGYAEDYTEIKDAFFVQLVEEGIGLDGVFYQDKRKTDFHNKLYEETIDKRISKNSKKDFEDVYAASISIEENLFSGNSGFTELIKNCNLQFPKNNQFDTPSATLFWKDIMEQISTSTISTDQVLDTIALNQNKIELELAGVRKNLELP